MMPFFRHCSAVLACLASACGSDPDPVPTAATGTLEAWVARSPLPDPVTAHCATATRDHLVVIGGTHKLADDSFVDHDQVWVAKLGDDGSLGAWLQAGTTPSTVKSCGAAADGDNVYLVGGTWSNEEHKDQVWRSRLSRDGLCGPWTNLGHLPLETSEIATASSAAIRNGRLIVGASYLNTDAGGGNLVAMIVEVGETLGEWRRYPWLDPFRYFIAYAFSNHHLYVMGGYGNTGLGQPNPVYQEVWGAPISAEGTIGDKFSNPDLPTVSLSGQAVAVDDFVFQLGGRTEMLGGGYLRTTYSAPIETNGVLGAWQSQPELPAALSGAAAVVRGDFLFLIGGTGAGGQTAEVYSARARFPRQ